MSASGARRGPGSEPLTALILSAPNVVVHNQLVYVRLAELGWRLRMIVPNRWRDEYTPQGFTPDAIEGLRGTFLRARVINPGGIQRHVYATRPGRWLERWRPDVAFLEQEPFSMPGLQWGWACQRAGIPWGLQGDENLDRPFPWPARVIRAWTLPRADFFAARSPAAGEMLRRWGAVGPVEVVPHTLPDWPRGERIPHERFTIGFAGRLVEAKGIDDLLEAVRRLEFPSRLLVVGDGPLRERVLAAELGQGRLELRTGLRSDAMPDVYREMDVFVLPSRTTPTWAEQFGKVLGESLLCGTPVVGSSSGEIPWVIETTQGGRIFPEGDTAQLAAILTELRNDAGLRDRLAEAGRRGVEATLSARHAAAVLDRLMRASRSDAPRSPWDIATKP